MDITAIQVGAETKKWSMSSFSSNYGPEEELQRILEEHPSLIPWKTIGASSELVILSREVVTVDGKRIDHLGVDSSGQIYVIECKIVANQELRAVIAQALEYCAQLSRIICVEDFLSLCERQKSELPFTDESNTFLNGLERCIQRSEFKAIVVTDGALMSSQARVNRTTINFLRRSLDIHLIEVSKFCSNSGDIFYVPHVTAGGPQTIHRNRDVLIWKRNFLGAYADNLDLQAALLKHLAWIEDVNPGRSTVTKSGALSSYYEGFYFAYFARDVDCYTFYIPPAPKEPVKVKQQWSEICNRYEPKLGEPQGKTNRRIATTEQILSYTKLLQELYLLVSYPKLSGHVSAPLT